MAGTFKARSQHPVGSLRTSSGLIMMVNFFLLLMATVISFTWRTNGRHYGKKHFEDIEDKWMYHLIALCIPLCGYLVIQFVSLCCCDCKNFKGIADVLMMMMCFVFGCLIIASGIYLHLSVHDKQCLQQRNCQQLTASIIIGYISGVLLFAESYFHLSEKNIVMKMV